MHWGTFKTEQSQHSARGWGCKVSEVRAGTTSPMPDHKQVGVLCFQKAETCIQYQVDITTATNSAIHATLLLKHCSITILLLNL